MKMRNELRARAFLLGDNELRAVAFVGMMGRMQMQTSDPCEPQWSRIEYLRMVRTTMEHGQAFSPLAGTLLRSNNQHNQHRTRRQARPDHVRVIETRGSTTPVRRFNRVESNE